MADILIRGIEMPPNVEGCEVIIRIQPNGEVLDVHKIHIGAIAIPLPAGHGNMIDMSALEDMDFESCDTDDCYEIKWRVSGRNHIRQIIKDAPIIISAEGDDN